MTAENSAGAASHETPEWHAIDWQAAHRNVRRLQARIVKATKEGRWSKVKALQHLLTRSFSGKVIAVRRVTENQGKNTPGVDKVVWDTPKSKMTAVRLLKQRGYKPRPLRRVYIPKANGKMRPLGIPTMRDRAMQALYLLALDPIVETVSDPNSYGFRPERSCADAIGQCFNVLNAKGSAQWILEGDIKGCFDNISHEWLLANVPMDRAILQKWLKAGYMDRSVLYPTETGTPQGGIISPALANLALNGLERQIRRRFPKAVGRAQRRDLVNVVRYADDFIITGRSRELLENEVKPVVEEFLRERGLELSSEKTVVTHIENGFDFLGQHVRKYDGKLLIKPSRKNVKAFLEQIRGVIKGHKQIPAADLVQMLNPKIKGWANYHRHVVSSDTFCATDSAIFECLRRWTRRRHSTKPARWLAQKYFCRLKDDNWRFFGDKPGKNGELRRLYLNKARDVRIVRHAKIQSDANPYDPEWEVYFEQRLGVKMEANLQGRRRLLRLWKEQNGVCPVCGERITKLTGWHNHHIVWRVMGGSDDLWNRVLLHPNCHNQVHTQGLTVTKPRLREAGVRKA